MTEAVQIHNLESFLSVFAAWERETRSEQTRMQDSDDHGLWIPLMSSRKDETAVWYWTFAKRSVWDSNSNFFLWYKQTATALLQLPGAVHHHLRSFQAWHWSGMNAPSQPGRAAAIRHVPAAANCRDDLGTNGRAGPRARAWDHFKILSNMRCVAAMQI